MRKITIAPVALLGLAAIAASFPEHPLKPATQYDGVIRQMGLVVAVIPVEDRQEQQKYLGIDFAAKEYVPLFLVLENQNENASYILRKSGITAGRGTHAVALAQPEKRQSNSKALEATAFAPYVGLFAGVAASKAAGLRNHLLDVEFQSTTLSPGKSAHGFLFVVDRGGKKSGEKLHLVLPFQRSGSDEVITIDYLL